MASLNKVFLMGNLTRDPEIRYTSGGSAVGNFGLAINRRYRTAGGEDREEVCFVDIEVWGRQAETCGNYLRKGAPALIEGRLRLDQWDDKQTGQKRSRLRVQADRVQFMGAPRGGEFSASGQEQRDGGQQQAPQQPQSSAPPAPEFAPPATQPDADAQMPKFEVPDGGKDQIPDDIPF
ncbi:MAG: single-stranded DNA-binding protein [Lentisphaeria bacterium]|nr:single-stranded DNA-binding protein [Lentisphaeria bacterium]